MSTQNIYYVYCYYDTRTEPYTPIYIGKGKHQRWTSHLSYTDNQLLKYKLKNILEETGKPAKVIKLHENLTNEESCAKEIEYISLYGRICNDTGTLCNFSTGGEHGSLGIKLTGQALVDKQNQIKEASLLCKQKRINSRPVYLGTVIGNLKVIKDLDIERRQHLIAECIDCGFRQQMRSNNLIKLKQQCKRCSNGFTPIQNLDTLEYYYGKEKCAEALQITTNTVNSILEGKSRYKVNLRKVTDLPEIKNYFITYPNIII